MAQLVLQYLQNIIIITIILYFPVADLSEHPLSWSEEAILAPLFLTP